MLRKLGENARASKLIETFFSKLSEEEIVSFSETKFGSEVIKDLEINETLERKMADIRDGRSIKIVLLEISDMRVNKKNIKFFSELSAETLHAEMMEMPGRDIHKIIQGCLTVSPNDENSIKLIRSMIKVVQIISEKSLIDAERMRRYSSQLSHLKSTLSADGVGSVDKL